MASSVVDSLDLRGEIEEHLEKMMAQIRRDWPSDVEGVVLVGSASRGDFIAGR